MDSKLRYNQIAARTLRTTLVLIAISALTACGGSMWEPSDEDIIGDKLTSVSTLRDTKGNKNKTIAMFDDTLRRIHQFDVDTMKKLRTLKVRHPKIEHSVLHDATGNYIIDLSQKGITIFNRKNQANHDPLRMWGKPKSAAFNAGLGILVIYDDLMNVGILKVNGDGDVLKTGTFGSVVGSSSIRSGELLANGDLILALSNGRVAKVNIDETLAAGKWVYTDASTGLSDMTWVARVPGDTSRVLIKHASGISLITVQNGSTVTNYSKSGFTVRAYSKAVDSHIVASNGYNNFLLIYSDGDTIKTRDLFQQLDQIMSSDLDLARDTWTLTMGQENRSYDIFSGNYNITRTNRSLKRFRPTDMMASETQKIPNGARILIAQDFMFELFPSDLGRVVRKDFVTGKKLVNEGFNAREFDR